MAQQGRRTSMETREKRGNEVRKEETGGPAGMRVKREGQWNGKYIGKDGECWTEGARGRGRM